MNKNEMSAALQQNICKVVFTKVNGETREMECTLREDIVPAAPPANPPGDTEVTSKRTVNEAVQVAWDVQKEAWRSFRVASVQEFEIKENN